MDYRDIQYILSEDDYGWQWTVFLGNPETVRSGHALNKGSAVIKVWAAIDRSLKLVPTSPPEA